MVDLDLGIKIATAITVLLAIPFALRKLYRWWRPIRVSAGYKLVFDGSQPDEIRATIVNLSREAQYIVECGARSTYSLRFIALRHIRSPLVPPRLYGNIWFDSFSFQMLDKKPKKLEPFEQIELVHRITFDHPLNLFLTPMFLIELKLSMGSVFRSGRRGVPERWRFVSSRRAQSPKGTSSGA